MSKFSVIQSIKKIRKEKRKLRDNYTRFNTEKSNRYYYLLQEERILLNLLADKDLALL